MKVIRSLPCTTINDKEKMNNKSFCIALIISIFFHIWIIPTFLFPFDMKEYQVNEKKSSSPTRITFFHLDSFAQSATESNNNFFPLGGGMVDYMSVEQKKTLAEIVQEETDQKFKDRLPVKEEITEQEKVVEKRTKETIKEEPVESKKEITMSTGKGSPEPVQLVKESAKGHSKTQNDEKVQPSYEKEAMEAMEADNMKLSEEQEETDSFPSVCLEKVLMNGSNQSEEEELPLDLTQSNFSDDQVIPPRIVAFSSPDYPEDLRKRGIEGRVQLKVLIDKEGKAIQAEIGKTSGYQAFDQAAIKSVYQWQFIPAQSGKRKRDSWVLIPVVFKLK